MEPMKTTEFTDDIASDLRLSMEMKEREIEMGKEWLYGQLDSLIQDARAIQKKIADRNDSTRLQYTSSNIGQRAAEIELNRGRLAGMIEGYETLRMLQDRESARA